MGAQPGAAIIDGLTRDEGKAERQKLSASPNTWPSLNRARSIASQSKGRPKKRVSGCRKTDALFCYGA